MCPRGTSKNTAFETPCKGRVNTSRNFYPKGSKKEAKQAKQAKQALPPPAPAAPQMALPAQVKDTPCKAQLNVPANKPQARKVVFAEMISSPPPMIIPVEASALTGVEKEEIMTKAQKKNAKRTISKHAAAAAAEANSQANTGKEAAKSDITGSAQDDVARRVGKDVPGPLGPASLAATTAWVSDLQKYNNLVGGALGAADATEEETSPDAGEHEWDAGGGGRERARACPMYLNAQDLEALKNYRDAGGRGRPPVAPVFTGMMLGAALLAAKKQAGWAPPEGECDSEGEFDGEGEEEIDELVALLVAPNTH